MQPRKRKKKRKRNEKKHERKVSRTDDLSQCKKYNGLTGRSTPPREIKPEPRRNPCISKPESPSMFTSTGRTRIKGKVKCNEGHPAHSAFEGRKKGK
jgi:hypothetical protein